MVYICMFMPVLHLWPFIALPEYECLYKRLGIYLFPFFLSVLAR